MPKDNDTNISYLIPILIVLDKTQKLDVIEKGILYLMILAILFGITTIFFGPRIK